MSPGGKLSSDRHSNLSIYVVKNKPNNFTRTMEVITKKEKLKLCKFKLPRRKKETTKDCEWDRQTGKNKQPRTKDKNKAALNAELSD